MGRYRKIETRLWADKKFCELSSLKPSGQALWLYLLTAPQPGPMPGLLCKGRAAFAEELGWSQKAFDKAFTEIEEQGMVKADFNARLVWIPNAIRYNFPENPNVVKSWGDEYKILPECDLLCEAMEAFKSAIYAKGDSFRIAFDEVFSNTSFNPSLNPLEHPSGNPKDKPLPNPSERLPETLPEINNNNKSNKQDHTHTSFSHREKFTQTEKNVCEDKSLGENFTKGLEGNPKRLFLHLWQNTPVFSPAAKIESPKEWEAFWAKTDISCAMVRLALENFAADVRNGDIAPRYVPSSPDKFVLHGWILRCQKRFAAQQSNYPPRVGSAASHQQDKKSLVLD